MLPTGHSQAPPASKPQGLAVTAAYCRAGEKEKITVPGQQPAAGRGNSRVQLSLPPSSRGREQRHRTRQPPLRSWQMERGPVPTLTLPWQTDSPMNNSRNLAALSLRL